MLWCIVERVNHNCGRGFEHETQGEVKAAKAMLPVTELKLMHRNTIIYAQIRLTF